MAREYSLVWAFDPFQDQPSFLTKRMFGSLAAYVHGRLMLCEDPEERKWKGKTYPFALWNGILIPTEKQHHDSLIREFSDLVSHPVLPKWLYLPMNVEEIEEMATKMGERIARNDTRFGVVPKERRRPK